MREIILGVILVISFDVMAKIKNKPILEVHFTKLSQSHTYKIMKNESKTNVYTLFFTNENKNKKSQTLTKDQVEQIKKDATRIIWQNEFRHKTSRESCQEYMSLKTELEKTRICYENASSVGRAFGFINSLNELVH